MTKKDFELIANAVRKASLGIGVVASGDTLGRGIRWGIDDVIHFLAQDLKNSNPRFDEVRFRKACAEDGIVEARAK